MELSVLCVHLLDLVALPGEQGSCGLPVAMAVVLSLQSRKQDGQSLDPMDRRPRQPSDVFCLTSIEFLLSFQPTADIEKLADLPRMPGFRAFLAKVGDRAISRGSELVGAPDGLTNLCLVPVAEFGTNALRTLRS